MHFTSGAYFQLHFRQFYHWSILYGPWLDCFLQQNDLGPYWVTLSGGIRDIAWRQLLKWNKQLMIRLEIVDTSQGDLTIVMPSPWGNTRMTVWCPYDFMGPARVLCGDLAGSLRLSQESRIILGQNWQTKIAHCPYDHLTVPEQGLYDVTAICLRATGLRFFQICHWTELNKIVEATMPVSPYDLRKVSLRRPQGNGDLDILRASYTRRKANVSEA